MKQRIDNRARLTRLATPQVERNRGTWLLTRPADAPRWPADEWERLDRYLIFGDERDMQIVRGCIDVDGPRVVRRVVELSAIDRVVSNEPCLTVLAMTAVLGNTAVRAMALEAVPEVARTRGERRKIEQYMNAIRRRVRIATPGTHRGGDAGRSCRLVRPPRIRGYVT